MPRSMNGTTSVCGTVRSAESSSAQEVEGFSCFTLRTGRSCVLQWPPRGWRRFASVLILRERKSYSLEADETTLTGACSSDDNDSLLLNMPLVRHPANVALALLVVGLACPRRAHLIALPGRHPCWRHGDPPLANHGENSQGTRRGRRTAVRSEEHT